MTQLPKRYRIEHTFPGFQDGIRLNGDGDRRIDEILATVQELKRFLDPTQRMADVERKNNKLELKW